jgi:hypothetical protein
MQPSDRILSQERSCETPVTITGMDHRWAAYPP